jgi:adenylate cyclase
VERRLAAILIADVVGYGTHSRTNEERTRERFNCDLREIIEPVIEKHAGRLVKTMGDGILAEFRSVVDAVRCAVEWQTLKATRRGEDVELVFRIGINLGDVISEPPDIHGDGVNLADRVQALSPAGGIALSGAAYEQVRTKIDARFRYIGARRVKSIPEPVKVYVIDASGAAGRQPTRFPRRILTAVVLIAAVLGLIPTAIYVRQHGRISGGADSPSLVVLPFDNLSEDDRQGHLADGITEDMTTELARVPGLFVVSRRAAFTYRDKSLTPQQAARELGVRYVLEGSVRRSGKELRITAQLVDAGTNGHIWANRYDGAWDDVFSVQDKIVGEIAETLQLKLLGMNGAVTMAGGTDDVDAYESYLQGRSLLKSDRTADWKAALLAYQKALDIDSDFGAAAAEIAWIYHDASGSRLSALGVNGDEALNAENKYLDVAQGRPSAAYYQLMSDRLVAAQKSDDAITSAQKAIDLDPSEPLSQHAMAYALILNGQPEKALDAINRATRIDPNWGPWRHFLRGFALFSSRRLDEASIELQKARSFNDGFEVWSRYLGGQLLLSIRGKEANTDVDASIRKELDDHARDEHAAFFTVLLAINGFPFKNYGDTEALLSGLREAGVPELPFDLDPKSPNRLTGEQIRKVFFGHELSGTQLETGEIVVRRTGDDGAAAVSVGTWHGEGVTGIEGDAICSWFPTSPRNCYTVFVERDAKRGMDGYLYVRPSARFRLFPGRVARPLSR